MKFAEMEIVMLNNYDIVTTSGCDDDCDCDVTGVMM